jgi:hypothetical protein
MSAFPVHVQRRFEQRWASRFPLPVAATASKNVGTKATTSKSPGRRRAAKTENPQG